METPLAREMRALWKSVRLDAIRHAVEGVILQLQSADPEQVIGEKPAPTDLEPTGAVRVALDTCCDELRVGCGLAQPHEVAARPRPTPAEDPGWEQRHDAALQGYRTLASAALQDALGSAPGA